MLSIQPAERAETGPVVCLSRALDWRELSLRSLVADSMSGKPPVRIIPPVNYKQMTFEFGIRMPNSAMLRVSLAMMPLWADAWCAAC